jgi:hypothetical protein
MNTTPSATAPQYARSARRSFLIRRKGTGSIVPFVAYASQTGGDPERIPAWTRWWLLGAVAGMTLLWIMIFSPITFPLALVVIVVLVVRSPERAALGGGTLIPTGLWFLYELRAAVGRCAEMDRSTSGSCEIYGVEEQGFAMVLYVLAGVGLTAYAALRPRLTRA